MTLPKPVRLNQASSLYNGLIRLSLSHLENTCAHLFVDTWTRMQQLARTKASVDMIERSARKLFLKLLYPDDDDAACEFIDSLDNHCRLMRTKCAFDFVEAWTMLRDLEAIKSVALMRENEAFRVVDYGLAACWSALWHGPEMLDRRLIVSSDDAGRFQFLHVEDDPEED